LVIIVNLILENYNEDVNMNHSPLEKSILATLAYFDCFDLPLRREEIFRWQYHDLSRGIGNGHSVNEGEINQALGGLQSQKVIEQDTDYFFLPGRRHLLRLREERFEENKRKWRIAKTAARWLRMAPFLKLVAVCNTLAINNARPESDIDFFIVTSSFRLFTCRAFITWLVSFLGLRRHGSKIKNRICLSFYVTEDYLDLKDILLEPRDPYFAFWLDQLVPLYDRHNFLSKLRAENQWVREYLPNAFSVTDENHRIKPGPISSLIQGLFELTFMPPLGNWLEDYLAKAQKKLMSNKQSVASQPDTRVIISDNMLKFHEEDRREEYRERFYRRLREMNILG
jgi:hypothetical protein